MVDLHAKKIVFVNPPYERIAPGYAFIRHITNRSPSLGLLHLAAQVRLHGYEPQIIESDILDLDADEVADRVLVERPAYVGITLFTVGVFQSVKIARRIKAHAPHIKIIVGGPHISSMGVETLERFPEFDVAVNGEGERVLVELLQACESGAPLSSIGGLLYRDNGAILTTEKPQTTNVLDDLPFPAWDLLPQFPHAYKLAVYDYPRGPVATIAASRGCPFHCKFCDTSTFGASVRYYTPAKMVEMMRHLNETYGVRHILFVDDLFLASRLRATDFCHRLIESGLKMTWSCAARVDTVRPDLLKLMRQAGCWQISFGLESGSDELLRAMDKHAAIEKSEQAVKWTHDAGIRVKGLFMLGYPGETRETIELTKAFVKRIPMTIMNLTKFTPYPGSPVYREIYGTNIRDDHWERMNGMNFVWAPPGIAVDELDRHYQQVIRSFYADKRVRREYVRLSVRYPGHLVRLAKCGVFAGVAKLRSLARGRRGLLTDGDELHLDAMPPSPAAPVARGACSSGAGDKPVLTPLRIKGVPKVAEAR
ncbi:MAG TPA: radical SAM protein [Tepidisphaeraceae bacterium]|jgi:radical SAM superfamily enzyme YgiQ (UPF0313 family)